MKTQTQTSDETLLGLTQALVTPPPYPTKGRGNRRTLFPFVRRQNSYGLAVWNAIPLPHKDVLKYGNAGRSAFQYRGVNGNIVISPEAYEAMRKLDIV